MGRPAIATACSRGASEHQAPIVPSGDTEGGSVQLLYEAPC